MRQIDKMGVQSSTKSQIQLVLITDDHDFAGDLLDIFGRSPYHYIPSGISHRDRVIERFVASVVAKAGRFPVVVVADYDFLGSDCVGILDEVRLLKERIAVECIVVRPPAAHGARQKLLAAGAVFFEPEREDLAAIVASH